MRGHPMVTDEFERLRVSEVLLHALPVGLGFGKEIARDGEQMILQKIRLGEFNAPVVEGLEDQERVVVVLDVDADEKHAVVERRHDRPGDVFERAPLVVELFDFPVHVAVALGEKPVGGR